MTVIGVLSSNGYKTEKLIRHIFSACGKKSVIADNSKLNAEQIGILNRSGIDYLIMTLKKEKIVPLYLDILILSSCSDITCELIKCVSANTRLIYNSDNESASVFTHPNAISYGMSYFADATVSSIDGSSFIYCLQKPVRTLPGEILCEGEKKINLPQKGIGINEMIAAVTCTELCGIYNQNADVPHI